MTETTIKPEDLKIGMHFRLTGDACNSVERNDKHIYEVVNLDSACKLGAHLMVKYEEGCIKEITIMPWVPVLRIE